MNSTSSGNSSTQTAERTDNCQRFVRSLRSGGQASYFFPRSVKLKNEASSSAFHLTLFQPHPDVRPTTTTTLLAPLNMNHKLDHRNKRGHPPASPRGLMHRHAGVYHRYHRPISINPQTDKVSRQSKEVQEEHNISLSLSLHSVAKRS